MKKYAELLENIETYALLVEAKKIFGPYARKSDGRLIGIIHDDDNKAHTISWPKHLMEEHLGRKLLPNETVDHLDSNFLNNSLDNLLVIDRAEHSRGDTRRVRLVKLKCCECGKEFERSPRLVRDKAKKKNAGPFCSKTCSGKYSRKRQLGLIDALPAQDHIPSEYYKQKYEKQATDQQDKWEILALADYLLAKYANFI